MEFHRPAPYAGTNRIRFNGFAGQPGISGPAKDHPKVCAPDYPSVCRPLQVIAASGLRIGRFEGTTAAIDSPNGSRRVRIFHVDAFTTRAFSGNPAAVVLHAERLGDQEMQRLARELNVGDTIFLLPADGPDHDLRARFFTPRTETGFVGHASIAAHAVLEVLGMPPCRRQKQHLGTVEFERLAGGGSTSYAFTQPPPPVQRVLDARALAPLLAALGLRADEP